MVSVVLAVDHATEDRVLPVLLEHGHDVLARVSRGEDVVRAVVELRPAVILATGDVAVLSRVLVDACDELGVRVVVAAADADEERNARRLGIVDVLAPRASAAEAEALVAGVDDAGERDAERRRGVISSVWGPAGAPGRTTVAIGVAVELAFSGARVMLVDADTWGAAIAPSLGLLDESSGIAAACRLVGQDALTEAELERVTVPRPLGADGELRVLTGLARTARWPDLSAERVTATLEACRSWADHVVIDTGFALERDEEISSDLFAPRRNAATFAALQSADRVLAVCRADPIGVSRFLRAYPDLLETVGQVPVRTVVNRVRSGPIGLGPAGQLRTTLERFGGIGEPCFLPADEKTADAAMLAASSAREVAPRSPLASSIRRLVREMAPTRRSALDRRRRRRAAA